MSIKFKRFLLFFIFFHTVQVYSENISPEHYRKKGMIQFNNEMYDFAMESFSKAVRIDKKDFISYNYMAEISLISGNRPQALSYYQASLSINNKQDDVLFRSGEIYDYFGSIDNASDMFQRALTLNEKNNLAMIGMSRILSLKNHFDESTRMFQKACDTKINLSAPLYNRSVDLIKKDDYDNAVKTLEECLKINPAHVDAYFELAQYYRYRMKDKEALKTLERLKYLQPHLEKTYIQIAYIYYTSKIIASRKKQLEYAERNVKKAIELNDMNTDYWEFLSELYSAMNMPDESKKAGDTAYILTLKKNQEN